MSKIRGSIRNSFLAAALTTACAVPFTSADATTPTFNVLYAFPSGGSNGANPWASLMMDAQGNIYGTTAKGGASACRGDGCGTIFMLAPPYGQNNQTVLHSFNGSDGSVLMGGLIMDAEGNLYGTASQGGGTGCGGIGCGTVFRLAPPYGANSLTVLHDFNGTDGLDPNANLIMDAQGNLYGTTEGGGAHGEGAIFEIAPPYGQNNLTVLYSFLGGTDGVSPSGAPLMDGEGNIYVTAAAGGAHSMGGVYAFAPPYGQNSETVLYSFTGGKDGGEPHSNLIMDGEGNLYGATAGGGMQDFGVVFKLAPPYGQSNETVIYTFPAVSTETSNAGGQNPVAGVIMDAQGNLYGTTQSGGRYGQGMTFMLAPPYGKHSLTALHAFSNGSDGSQPTAGLIMDSTGNVYGTATYGGGTSCFNGFACGTVYEIAK